MKEGVPLDTDVAIETPEHIVFRHRVAGPARRLLAYLLDLVICYASLAAIAFAIFVAVAGLAAVSGAAENAAAAGVGLVLLLLFAIQWLYFTIFEALRGRTPGKAAFGCRVVTTMGRPIGPRAAALRNVLRAADALPLTYTAGLLSVTGLVSMSVTRRFQRLGDLVAGTMVVVPERARVAEPLLLSPAAGPRELAELGDVDVRLDAEERQAIEMFLRRRASLGPAREHELARMISAAMAARCGPLSADPSRALALLYDRAAQAGRVEAPPSSMDPRSWR
jgi:uncharacterized RDD family membrane protein YckC